MSVDTIGSGGDTPTVITWAGGIPGTLLENEEGRVLNQEVNNTSDSVDLSGVTTGAFSITLTANPGASFVDVLNPATTAVRYYAGTQGAAVLMSSSCQELKFGAATTVSKLMFKKTSGYGVILYSTNDAFTANQLIMYSTDGNYMMRGPGTFQRLIAYADVNIQFYQGNLATFRNWSYYRFGGGSTIGLESQYSGAKSINGAVAGCGANGYEGTSSATSLNNATDQGSFGGIGFDGGTPQTSLVAATEWTNVASAAAADFRIASGSAKLKANGTTGGSAPATDIFGVSWNAGTPDIGAIKFAGAAPSNDWVPNPYWQQTPGMRPRGHVGY